MVYAPVIGTFRLAVAKDGRKANSSLWYGSLSEIGPVTAAFAEDLLSKLPTLPPPSTAPPGGTAAASLLREQGRGHEFLGSGGRDGAHARASFRRADASPRTRTFRSATSVGSISSSLLDDR